MEICKDMDFPLLSRQYGNDGAGLMLVPAYDFVTDGWLHGRMAILKVWNSRSHRALSRGREFLPQRMIADGCWRNWTRDLPRSLF